MKRTLASSLLLLLFVTFAAAQTRTGPQLGTYGNVIGIKDTKGKYILSKIPRPWREGYAIAYRVKNKDGVGETRVVYVIGDQRSSRKLRVQKAKSTSSKRVVVTPDRVLEITRSFAWDEKSRQLQAEMTILNRGNVEVSITAVEVQLDNRLVSAAGNPRCPIPIPINYNVYDALPPCPCGDNCEPDGSVLYRQPYDERRENPFGLPSFGRDVFSLFWTGSVLDHPRLSPGDSTRISAIRVLAR